LIQFPRKRRSDFFDFFCFDSSLSNRIAVDKFKSKIIKMEDQPLSPWLILVQAATVVARLIYRSQLSMLLVRNLKESSTSLGIGFNNIIVLSSLSSLIPL
jgi:hypothetical protein